MCKEVMVILAAALSITANTSGHARARPDMIIWSICIAPQSGSALSIYSRPEGAAQSFVTAEVRRDLCIVCANYAEQARKRSVAWGAQSADPDEADPDWSICDANGIDNPRGLTGRRN